MARICFFCFVFFVSTSCFADSTLKITALAREVSPPEKDLIAGPPDGPWRRLFLDATVTEEYGNLTRIFHQAKKYAGNPVLKRTKPWEGEQERSGPYLYGTVMWDDGKLRLWYPCFYKKGYLNPYAESRDGISWTKPTLGLLEFQDSKWKGGKFNKVQKKLEKKLRFYLS